MIEEGRIDTHRSIIDSCLQSEKEDIRDSYRGGKAEPRRGGKEIEGEGREREEIVVRESFLSSFFSCLGGHAERFMSG